MWYLHQWAVSSWEEFDENQYESLSISIDLYLLAVTLELLKVFNSEKLIQLRLLITMRIL